MSSRSDNSNSEGDTADSLTQFIDPAAAFLTAYDLAEQAAYSRGLRALRDPPRPPWHLFQLFSCCCRTSDPAEAQLLLGESISARASPASSSVPAGGLQAAPLIGGGQSGSTPEVTAQQIRIAGRATMLVTAFLVAIAQWAALASGVRFFEDLVGLDEDGASAASSAVLAVCFLSSIAGGILGDALWGNVKTLFVGLLGALISSTTLALATLPQLGWGGTSGAHGVIGVSVFAFAISIGLCQTAIPSLVGDQCHAEPNKLQRFYNGYYALIQCGAFISRVLFPLAHEQLDWFIAICLCVTTPVALGLLTFSLNISILTHRPPTEQVHAWRAFMVLVRRVLFCASPEELEIRYGENSVQEADSASILLKLHLPLPIFWGLYFQMFVLWYLQAQQLNLVLFGSTKISAEQATALNPLFDVVLLVGLSSLAGQSVMIEGTTKILLGYLSATAAFGYGIALQLFVTHQNASAISVWWQLPQYLLLCAAEVLVYPAALHEVYTRSPTTIRSFMQSCLWFFIGVGNTVNVVVLASDDKLGGKAAKDGSELTPLFVGYAAAMLLATLLYIHLMMQYRAHSDITHRDSDEENGSKRKSVTRTATKPSNENAGPSSQGDEHQSRSSKSVTTDSMSMFSSNMQDSQQRFGLPPLAATTNISAGPPTHGVQEQRRIPISPRTSTQTPVYHSTRKSPRVGN